MAIGFTIAETPFPSITCHTCGRTSYHREDIRQKYCGCCHKFHELEALDRAMTIQEIFRLKAHLGDKHCEVTEQDIMECQARRRI